jgi:GTP-binding protein
VIVLSAEFVKSATRPAEYPAPGPREVAFCGRSNVGKSSCLNALAQRKSLARVSRTPGRTRLINFFDLRVAEARENPQEIRFADLPGYGYASGPKSETKEWQHMIEEYLTSRPQGLVVLVDGEIGAQPSDIEMVRWGESLGRRVIAVATKLDKLSRSRRQQQTGRIAGQLAVPEVIAFSAKERLGVEELWRALLSPQG